MRVTPSPDAAKDFVGKLVTALGYPDEVGKRN
jgi:hypothetical protein